MINPIRIEQAHETATEIVGKVTHLEVPCLVLDRLLSTILPIRNLKSHIIGLVAPEPISERLT